MSKPAPRAQPWDELRQAVVAAVEERAGALLAKNAAAREVLIERAERMAELSYLYVRARTKKDRDRLRRDMEVVKQTLENRVAELELAASDEARALFRQVAGAVFDVLLKALPVLIG